MSWKVDWYTDRRGQRPVQIFLESLTDAEKAKFLSIVQSYLVPNGLNVRGEILHKIDDLYQFRFYECRVFMYLPPDEPMTFQLLSGFKKKSNETPKKEIERAKNYRVDDLAQKQEKRKAREEQEAKQSVKPKKPKKSRKR